MKFQILKYFMLWKNCSLVGHLIFICFIVLLWKGCYAFSCKMNFLWNYLLKTETSPPCSFPRYCSFIIKAVPLNIHGIQGRHLKIIHKEIKVYFKSAYTYTMTIKTWDLMSSYGRVSKYFVALRKSSKWNFIELLFLGGYPVVKVPSFGIMYDCMEHS